MAILTFVFNEIHLYQVVINFLPLFSLKYAVMSLL